MYVVNNMDSLEVLVRKRIFGFMERLNNSDNTIIQCINNRCPNYLGTVLSNNPKAHTDARVQAARRAFYDLQSSGMCEGGVSPVVSAHMYKVAICRDPKL